MKGIIGKKIGMTSMFNAEGRFVPVTLVEAQPNVVTQVRSNEVDGYEALQLAFDDAPEKSSTQAMMGHFSKAKTGPKRKLVEFRNYELEANLGDTVGVEIFDEGETVHVVGTTKGKGFQGVVRRHGFGGVGMRTHGQHNRLRAPGSIGACATPSRVFKGMRMAGRMGGVRRKVKNLRIVKVMEDKNVLVIRGNVPGAKGSYVIVESNA